MLSLRLNVSTYHTDDSRCKNLFFSLFTANLREKNKIDGFLDRSYLYLDRHS